MSTIAVLNIQGKKVSTTTLPKEIFGQKVNLTLIGQAVRVFLSNQRKANAKTKNRGELAATGKKIYRQKGTGGARHGDKTALIFVKGAAAFGPTGEQNYHLHLSKKMKRQALLGVLSNKLKDQEIFVIQGLEKIPPKSKEMAKVFKNLKLKVKNQKLTEKVMLVLPKSLINIFQAGRNLTNLSLKLAKNLNTYEVLYADKLILMKESISVLKETYGVNTSH